MGLELKTVEYQDVFDDLIDVDFLTSTMFQRHIWQASDGVLLSALQIGSSVPAPYQTGLVISRSLDNGLTWSYVDRLSAGTVAICDGFIDTNDDVYVAYSVIVDTVGSEKDVFFRKLTYDASNQTWSMGSAVTVYNSDASHGASYVVMRRDALGAYWCAFRLYDSLDYEIAMYYSIDSGATWIDSTQTFGTFNSSNRKVPLLMPIGSQMMLIYHDDEGAVDKKKSAIRENTDAKTAAWDLVDIKEHEVLSFGNHFSGAKDGNDKILLAVEEKDGASNEIFVYEYENGSWDSGMSMSYPNLGGIYPAIAHLGGGVFVAFAGLRPGIQQKYLAARYYVNNEWILDTLFRYAPTSEDFFEEVIVYNGTTQQDKTSEAQDDTVADIFHSVSTAMVDIIGDYIEFGSLEKHDYIVMANDTAGTVGAITWKYWNGVAWSNLSISDSLNPDFDGAGTYIRFTIPTDWEKKIEGVQNLYFIRAEVTTGYTIAPIGTQTSTIKYRRRLAIPEEYNPSLLSDELVIPGIIREGIEAAAGFKFQSTILDLFIPFIENVFPKDNAVDQKETSVISYNVIGAINADTLQMNINGKAAIVNGVIQAGYTGEIQEIE